MPNNLTDRAALEKIQEIVYDDSAKARPSIKAMNAILDLTRDALRRGPSEQDWLEDELMEVMRIVAPGMASAMPDEITYAIMVTAIRRLMEADTDRYEALLERWQKRQNASPATLDSKTEK